MVEAILETNAEALAQLIFAVRFDKLENRRYNSMEFVENGWV